MYKKLRFYLRLLVAVVSKYRWGIITAVVVAGVLIAVVPHLVRTLPRTRSLQRIAHVGRFTLSTLPLPVQQKISIGLTTVDPSGLPSPALAESWEATDSGKTYIFTINRNLKWQDGSAVTSKDIQYNFRDAVVEYPDDSHLTIKMQDPFSPLPTIVSRPVFKYTAKKGFFSSPTLTGVGQYRIATYKRNGAIIENITLYPHNQDNGLPRIKYFFYPSPQQARTAFKLGLVDTIEDVQDPADLKEWPGIKITSQPQYDRYVAVFFNTQDPELQGQDGRNLRLALNYAVDKARWTNRAVSPIPPTSWVGQSEVKRYEKDVERAKSIIKRLSKPPGKITISTVPTFLHVAEQVKQDWEAIGIQVEIQVSPEIPSQFQSLVVAQAIPVDPDQYNLWHSTQEATNLTKLNNPRIDKLLEDGRKTFDIKSRKIIYSEFQKFLVDEVPAIFLFYPETYSLTRD